MNFIEIFLPNSSREPQVKIDVVAIEKDWQFLKQVFPEPGFRSYFLGHIVSKLAKELREDGITDYHERAKRPDLTDISRLLSNIRITRKEDYPDERRRVGSAHNENENRSGESPSNEGASSRKAEEGEISKESKEAGPINFGLARCEVKETCHNCGKDGNHYKNGNFTCKRLD